MVAAIAAVNGKAFILRWLHFSISPMLYLLTSFTFIWVAVFFGTNGILRDLRMDRNEKMKSCTEKNKDNDGHPRLLINEERTFGYPNRIGYMFIFIGVLFVAAPVFFPAPERHLSLPGYILCACIGLAAFWYAIRALRYYVQVSQATIKIRDITERSYAIGEIKAINVAQFKGSRVAIVTFHDGQTLRFSGMIKDFSILIDAINDAVLSKQAGT